MALQNNRSRDFPASDSGDQLVEVRDLPDIRKLIQQTPHMDRQSAAVEVVRLVAQQIEKLRVHERRHKIESAVRIREDDEQRRFAVAQGIQLQLVLRHEVPQLRDVKGRKAGAAGNQNRLQSFARGHFEFAVLLHGEVVRVLLLQLGEQQVHGGLELLVVLPRLAGVDEVQQGDEVALLRLRLVPDVPDEGRIVQALGFDPKILGTLFALSLGVKDQGVHQLQNILLAADVRQRVVPHGLLEVDEVQAFNAVSLAVQQSAHLVQDGALGVRDHIGGMALEQVGLDEKPRFA